MITRLGRLSPELLGVIARTSAMRYKKTDKPIDQIGRELGVAYVIEGGVRRAGESVRINAQLIQVSDQTQLWGDSYTRDLSDVFAVQADVAEAVAKALAVELLPQEESVRAKPPTESSAAYDAYLLGRSYWAKRTPESLYTAIKHFERAVKLDPNYALAYSGLADAWGVLPWYVPGPFSEMYARAEENAERALALDDSLAEPNVSIALVLGEHDKPEAALPYYRKAIAIDPNNATARQWYGLALCLLGRADDGLAEFERGVSLDPLSAVMRLDYGYGMLLARQYNTSIEQLKRTLELQPDFFNAAGELPWAYIGKVEHGAAAESFEKYLALLGQPTNRVTNFRSTYESSGLKQAILGWLASISTEVEIPRLSTGDRARLHAWCGDHDRAFELLDRLYQQKSHEISHIRFHLAFDSLRDDPRFDDLLRKAGLAKVDLPSPTTTP